MPNHNSPTRINANAKAMQALPVLLIPDNLPRVREEVNKIYGFDNGQLAKEIRRIVPGRMGALIADFLQTTTLVGWEFTDLPEELVQKLSENDPTITQMLLHLQGKTPLEQRTSLENIYPHLAGKVRRVSSFMRSQPDVAKIVLASSIAESTLDSRSRNFKTPQLLDIQTEPGSPWPFLEPLLSLESEANAPTTQPSTPLIDSPPISTNASQASFYTAADSDSDSRVDPEGADLDEGPSPSRSNRDEGQLEDGSDSSDESAEGYTDTLLTPLQLVPNLTSDLENYDQHRLLRHPSRRGEEGDDGDSDAVAALLETDVDKERFEDPALHPDLQINQDLDSDGDSDATQPASLRPHPSSSSALRVDLNFPAGYSMLQELSALSPHFSTVPLAAEPTSAASTPRATRTRSPGRTVLRSPRQERLSSPRTLWPIVGGRSGYEGRRANLNVSPRTSPRSAGGSIRNTSTSLVAGDGAVNHESDVDSMDSDSETTETGSPSWWGSFWA